MSRVSSTEKALAGVVGLAIGQQQQALLPLAHGDPAQPDQQHDEQAGHGGERSDRPPPQQDALEPNHTTHMRGAPAPASYRGGRPSCSGIGVADASSGFIWRSGGVSNADSSGRAWKNALVTP